MTQKIGAWLMSVAAASLCSALTELMTPSFRDGMEKYVKFVSAAAILAVVIMPLSGIVAEFEKNLDKFGIFYEENNINVTENTEADKWILKSTVYELERGIEKLIYEHFSVSVTAEVSALVTQNGIEISSVYLYAPTETADDKIKEMTDFVGSYLGVKAYGKAGER